MNLAIKSWVVNTQRCDVCGRTCGSTWTPAVMLGKDGEEQDVKVCKSCSNVLMPDTGMTLEPVEDAGWQ